MAPESPAAAAERAFAASARRRAALAALPVEEKLRILVELQRLASAVAAAAGRPARVPWRLHPGEPSDSGPR